MKGDYLSAADAAAYLVIAREACAARILRRSDTHHVTRRLEATATILAGLATLHTELSLAGEAGNFREIVHRCINEIVDAAHADCEARR